ncbi:hypothetical protein J3458_004624 [Metarhizium acridum]|uniref:GRF-type domain-containing protein n=1 Tax=Metarhizium acridum (strain CQMa 102) TaxID=655827 RepID=E9DTW2_METAQ|nr:uncharacterized protein MAC_01060 [Metarhizium acridum CQMa 102]EFY92822.1 hypothetical protein MAC_01060 [Metarhizium acridum CQMa 102]KAG8419783.1 hypothetical protein J3458_004624 [Metarhizium acridum]
MASSTTPRRRHYKDTPSTPVSPSKAQELPSSQKKRLDGVWQDGLWWCNCDPRKKAVLREVKKDGPNKGRLFWTCEIHRRLSCNFFLWRDDAVVRESGSAPGSDADLVDNPAVPTRPKTPTFTQRPLESYGIQATPSCRRDRGLGGANKASKAAGSSPTSSQRTRETQALASLASPATPSSKRKRNPNDSWDEDDDEDEFTDLDSDLERQLAEITDKSVQMATLGLPSDDAFSTPSTNRRTTVIVGGLPTPSVSRTLFPASEAKRSKAVSFEEPTSSDTLTTPSKTPSSDSSFSLVCASSSPPDATTQDVTEKVMTLLSRQKIDPAVLQSVQGLLLMSARKTKGLSLGRDSARAALKEKDKKISQLQEKIRDLENQAAYNHKRMTNMKAQLIRLYEEN